MAKAGVDVVKIDPCCSAQLASTISIAVIGLLLSDCWLQRRQKTLQALWRQFETLSRRPPLLAVFEVSSRTAGGGGLQSAR
jgi:hypothetical protein